MEDIAASAPATLDFRIVDALSLEDRRTLFEWGDDVFRARGIQFDCRKGEHHLLGYADGQLVSHASLVKAEVRVGERWVHVGGIGGVVTVGSAQGKGYAGQLLRRAVAYACETWHVKFVVLFCLPHVLAFYQKLGWREIPPPVFIEQPAGRVPSPLHVLQRPCASDDPWPPGVVEIGMPW